MNCPRCATLSRVIETRDASDASDRPASRRRRGCPACGYHFTTFELVVGDADSRGGKTGPRRAIMLTNEQLAVLRAAAALVTPMPEGE